MTPAVPRPSREEVLDAFAVEPSAGRETLERYLRAYPEFAAELVDLSRELSRAITDDEDAALSPSDQALIASAWRRHAAAGRADAADPLAALSVDERRELARRLGVPLQVVSAFREHRVIIDSVPAWFLESFAGAVSVARDALVATLAGPATPASARSFKSDDKPDAGVRVTFEKILADAGVDEARRRELLKDRA